MSVNSEVRWVTTSWLEDHLEDEMTIIDCQPNVHDYIRGHVPGAVYLGEESLRLSQGGKPHVWIDENMASQIFSFVGVRRGFPVLVYSRTNPNHPTGDGVPQSMVAYSLVRYGHTRVLIMDGGFDEWSKEGKAVETTYPRLEPVKYPVSLRKDLFISYEEFVGIKDDQKVVHIDSRSPDQYQGRSAWPKEGHIPGAINIPWSEAFTPGNLCKLRLKVDLLDRFKSAGATPDKEIICHCGSGRKAAAQLCVLKWYLKYPKIRLFEGSLTEWCSHPNNGTVLGRNP